MALSITNPTLSGSLVKADVEQNFTDIETKFDTTKISNADISEFANIRSSKLAANAQKIYVNLTYTYNGTAFSALTEGDPVAVYPIPYGNDTSYLVETATWYCTDTGNGATTFDVLWGYYDPDSGILTNHATVISEEIITNRSAANDNEVSTVATDDFELAWPDKSKLMFLYLARGATAGSATVDSASDVLSVTLRLSKRLTSR